MTQHALDQSFLDEIFPAQRANDFFDALFGGAEDGAYDIRLVQREASADHILLAFDLTQRAGKCLVCNLTYGLPQVFQRHPVINVAGIAAAVAQRLQIPTQNLRWSLAPTQEISRELHRIPLRIEWA